MYELSDYLRKGRLRTIGASTDLFEQVWKKQIIATTSRITLHTIPAINTIQVHARTTEIMLTRTAVIEILSDCFMWNER